MKTWIVAVLISLLSSKALAAAQLTNTSYEQKGSKYIAELTFSEPISEKKVSIEYINSTIQLNIQNAFVENGPLLKRIKDSQVKSLYTYQVNPEVLRSRIILSKKSKAKDFEGFVRVSSAGKVVRFEISDPTSVISKSSIQDKLPIIPPIDLNKELEPKRHQSNSDDELSAASLLEREFLKSKNKKTKSKLKKLNKEKSTSAEKQQKTLESLAKEESEIPVNLAGESSKDSAKSPWTRMIISLIVVSLFGIGVTLFARRYSKSKMKIGGNVNIQIISQQSLGPKKNLTVINVAGENILIGVTDHNISLIKSLAFIDDEIEQQVPVDFVNELNKVTDEYVSRRKGPSKDIAQRSHESEEDFNMGNIKDMISSKLKEMRPL